MALYRCYLRDGRGLAFSTFEFEALDDNEAVAKARALCASCDFTLSQGQRTVVLGEVERRISIANAAK